VDGADTLHVEANRVVAIGGHLHAAVEQTRHLVVARDLSIAVGGSRDLRSGGSSSVTVTGPYTASVAGDLRETAPGGIGIRAASVSLSVGAAAVLDAQTDVQLQSDAEMTLTVAGAAIEEAGGNYAWGSRTELALDVGGNATFQSGKGFSLAGPDRLEIVARDRLDGSSECVVVEGKESIVLRSGATSISIFPDRVELKAPALRLSSGEDFRVEAKLATHN
jgi:uncharacterized protein (DUF2345 family)